MKTLTGILLVLALSSAGCDKNGPAPEPESQATAEAEESAKPGAVATRAVAPSPGSAKLGAPAPDFELQDLDGKAHRLSAYRGKVVVLEWFNPGCPFVKNSHIKGSLVDTAARHAKAGVVWLAINSGAPGKQGHGVEANREAKEDFSMSHPILLDEAGHVGKAYGAEHTPHLFVIDDQGKLVYRGAIDNSPDGEGQSPSGDKLVNYVDQALAELVKGQPVSEPDTKAYGCSVKYE